MKIQRFIGDVHGKYDQYKRILAQGPNTIQVGDMGVGFRRWPHGEVYGNPPHYAMVPHNHRFIRGNHDNPAVCVQHSQWIKDGHIEDGMMFVGGATSIDKEFRRPEFSWWRDEECSQELLDELRDKYVAAKPQVMVTHDCPEFVAHELFKRHYKVDLEPGSTRTRRALEQMWHLHRPKLWVFGHWHESRDVMVESTRFVCLAELEAKDFDVS